MYIHYICILAPFIQIGFSLIGEETDLKPLSSYEAIDNSENFEIWNAEDDAGIVVFDTFSKQKIDEICKDSNTLVYISEEDVTIDCKTYNSGDKPIETNRIKRAADELEEGSGEPDHETTPNSPEEAPAPDSENAESADVTTIENAVPTTVNSADEEASDSDSNVPEIFANETELNATDVETPVENTDTKLENNTNIEDDQPTEDPSIIENINEPSTPIDETNVANETPIDANVNLGSKSEEGDINVTDIKNELPVENTNESSQKPNEDTKQEVDNNERKEHGDHTDNQDKNSQFEKKEDHKVGAKSTIENNDESVKTHESTQDPKKAGTKDTTILVVLFVAVVVVGALAFGYNFIKKRKQRNADLERVERGSVKLSLPNLTKQSDEPEKKPLMDNGKEVEMVDMKKESSSLEPTQEREYNDSTVKT